MTPPSLLEIGPGSRPLVSPSGSDWQGYQEGGLYFGVQPDSDSWRGNSFPKDTLSMERVKLFRCTVAAVGGQFDEVIAINVLGDPITNHLEVIEGAIRSVKVGGLITYIETYTPEESPGVYDLMAAHGIKCSLVAAAVESPTAFANIARPYSSAIRLNNGLSTYGNGQATQFKRIN
jgi:hypothetical protein